jgi:hypothetical protein
MAGTDVLERESLGVGREWTKNWPFYWRWPGRYVYLYRCSAVFRCWRTHVLGQAFFRFVSLNSLDGDAGGGWMVTACMERAFVTIHSWEATEDSRSEVPFNSRNTNPNPPPSVPLPKSLFLRSGSSQVQGPGLSLLSLRIPQK